MYTDKNFLDCNSPEENLRQIRSTPLDGKSLLIEQPQTEPGQSFGKRQPTLLLLATPTFCQTRFCGPADEMVGQLQKDYGEQVNFTYAEVFDGLPDPGLSGFQPSAVAREFGIESEPWAYFIDKSGTIVYRLEGLFSIDELDQQIQKRLDF